MAISPKQLETRFKLRVIYILNNPEYKRFCWVLISQLIKDYPFTEERARELIKEVNN